MGQKVIFDGKLETEPTAKARIISGVQNIGAPSSFGNICIIDNGFGAGFGGGKGVLDSGSNTNEPDDFIHRFDSASEMKNFVKGGKLWDIADYIYSPSTSGPGASTVYFIRACQTLQAQDTAAFTGVFDMILNTLEEGVVTNGVLSTTDLASGYGWTISAGAKDPLKFVFKFYQGQYRGVDADGLLFDGIDIVSAAESPKLIVQSEEVATLAELITWSATSPTFNEFFEFDAGSDIAGTFVAGDLTLLSGFQLFAGATETYSSTALDAVLDNIKELDNTFFLSLDGQANAAGTNNLKILAHINNEAEFKKFIVIGGGDDSTKFEGAGSSVTSAATLNSRYAIVCHSGLENNYILNPAITVNKSSIYMACLVVGRLAGFEPQTPLTYKNLRIRKLKHTLKQADRVTAINSGVLHVRTVPQLGFVVNQAINSLQLNDFLINPDGSSPEISIERIEAQLNREISSNSRVLFIGGNLFNVGGQDLTSFTKAYLNSKLAITGRQDGLIIGFGNIKAKRVGSTFFVTYDFQANSPINKVFTTGTIVDPSIG